MLKKVQKLRFTGKFLVKRAYTELIVYSRFTVFFRENTVNRYIEIEVLLQ
jgi:hypothetical protein